MQSGKAVSGAAALAVLCLLLCSNCVESTVTLSTGPNGATQVIILGGTQRPAMTDEGHTLPPSIKKYTCTSLDGPTCGLTSKTSIGSATAGGGISLSGADLQKLFAEAIAKAALDSVSKALASSDKESTSTTTTTLPIGSEPSLSGPGAGGAAANSGGSGSGTPAGAATLTTTTTKGVNEANGATTTSTTAKVETDSGTIETAIQLQAEPSKGGAGAGSVALTPEQKTALMAQINAQVGKLFAGGDVQPGVQTFQFALPDGVGGGAGAGAIATDVDGPFELDTEIEIVDSEMLFGSEEEAEEFMTRLENGESVDGMEFEEIDENGNVIGPFDPAGAGTIIGAGNGGAVGGGGVRIASSTGVGAARAVKPMRKATKPAPAAASAGAGAGAAKPAAPAAAAVSTKADAPPNSDSRVRSAKAVELASDRGVIAASQPAAAGASAADTRRAAKAKAPPLDEVAEASSPAHLNAQQSASLRARSGSASVIGAPAAGAGNAKAPKAAAPAAAAAKEAAKPAEPEPKLDDDKSHILQLFELYQKKAEQKDKKNAQKPRA